MTTGKELLSLHGHEWYLSSVAFGPKGRRLISGSDDTTARTWELAESYSHYTVIKIGCGMLLFSPDGEWVATASSDHTAKVWDASTGKEVVTINQYTASVTCVAFSLNELQFATASQDGTIKLWDFQSLANDK